MNLSHFFSDFKNKLWLCISEDSLDSLQKIMVIVLELLEYSYPIYIYLYTYIVKPKYLVLVNLS